MPDFAGLRVAAFESRRAEEMARLIEKMGGVARVSPSMREVSVGNNAEAIDFANRLMTGQVDVMIFLTGVGIRHLLTQIERHVDQQRFLESLSDITTIVRGPKPLAVLRELGITPTHRVPEPNTWRELLQVIDRHVPVANQTVGLQEHGESNASLIAGLEARGARVVNLKVYEWDLPEDVKPLEANVRAIIVGEIDLVMFTSSRQLVNLLHVAEQMQLGEQLRQALSKTVIASIGPTMSESIRQHGLSVDMEPSHPKMGHLVAEAAELGPELVEQKRRIHSIISSVSTTSMSHAVAMTADAQQPWYNSPFMKACRRESSDQVPVWLMRQAGRYMAEYREVRAKTTFLELCKNPELCAEVMITAVNRIGVDAAIIFADLLPILEPMGLDLEFAQGEGPVIHNPVREAGDVTRVLELESVESLHFVMETVKLTRDGLPAHIPVIGFAGAPFTLASYAIEGGSSRNYLHTKTLMYRDLGAWDALMSRLSRAVTRYLNAQAAAGAQALQLFDSWAGCLGPDDYRKYVLPYTQAIIQGVAQVHPHVPVINFATGNPALLPLLAEAGGAVIGIDWRIGLDDAWKTVGYDKAVQGNLDPLILLASHDEIRRRAKQVLAQAGGRPGHIFNLGHGILPQTPVENVIALVDAVHEFGAK